MFAALAGMLLGAPMRASRAALRRACSPSLKDQRDWEVDQIPPPRPGTPFSFRGRLPKVVAIGHGLSSSDEATASESGVARLIVKIIWAGLVCSAYCLSVTLLEELPTIVRQMCEGAKRSRKQVVCMYDQVLAVDVEDRGWPRKTDVLETQLSFASRFVVLV